MGVRQTCLHEKYHEKQYIKIFQNIYRMILKANDYASNHIIKKYTGV